MKTIVYLMGEIGERVTMCIYFPHHYLFTGSSTTPDSTIVWESVLQEGRVLDPDTLQVCVLVNYDILKNRKNFVD